MGPAQAFPGVGIAVDSSGNIYGSGFSRILVLKPAGATPPTPVAVDFVHNAASDLFLGIAPGEIVTFKGSGLGPAQLVAAHAGADGFYPTQLSGTSVQFNGVAAPMLYTSATQVAAVVPLGVTGPTAQVTMTYQGQAPVPATIQVFPSAPGLFTLDGSGTGQAGRHQSGRHHQRRFQPGADRQRHLALRDRRRSNFAGRRGWPGV